MDLNSGIRSFPRFVISGDHGSAGKTTLSIGLGRYYTNKGLKVQPFKKGPDFIDPIWSTAATGVSCRNLDFFMMEDRIMETFIRYAMNADLSFLEGNKGLFDGVDTQGSNATSAMARLLKAPVVLVVDSGKMTRGIAPLLIGYKSFEPDIDIAGVIMNRVSGARHEGKLRAAVEYYTDIPVLGALPRDQGMEITERHLGLIPASEDGKAEGLIEALERYVADGVDTERILKIAEKAANLPAEGAEYSRPVIELTGKKTIRIGIARDEAFCFYYPENLEALEERGCELVFFSPLHDEGLPEVDGLYIGGGFPEQFAAELAKNTAIKDAIHNAIINGIPAYAECGGLMYLSERLRLLDGSSHDMVGAVPAGIRMDRKPSGRGYMIIKTSADKERHEGWRIPPGLEVKAHEFHYSRLEDETVSAAMDFSYDVVRGYGVNGSFDGIRVKNLLASYMHLHHYGAPWWADSFVELIRREKAAATEVVD